MISYQLAMVFIVISLFIGIALGSGMRKPHRVRHVDGFLDVSERDVSTIYQLEITTPPEVLKVQKNVVFKVRKFSSS